MNIIRFHDYNCKSRLTQKRSLKLFLKEVFKRERKITARIDIIFSTDDFLLSLNKKYLDHHYFTDTLSFKLQETPLVGEIYISIDRVLENSSQMNISYHTELLRVIIHSCLHLCGYNDTSPTLKNRMTKMQEKYLSRLLVSRETQIGG